MIAIYFAFTGFVVGFVFCVMLIRESWLNG